MSRFYNSQDYGLEETPEKLHSLVSFFQKEGVQRILDAGSGYGRISLYLKSTGHFQEIVAFDNQAAALSKLRAKMRRLKVEIELVRGSITNMPFKEGSFDAIISWRVLHHFNFRKFISHLAWQFCLEHSASALP